MSIDPWLLPKGYGQGTLGYNRHTHTCRPTTQRSRSIRIIRSIRLGKIRNFNKVYNVNEFYVLQNEILISRKMFAENSKSTFRVLY